MKTNCDTFVTEPYMDSGCISFYSDLSVFKTYTINLFLATKIQASTLTKSWCLDDQEICK